MDPISICDKVWQYAGDPITRQFGYLISYGDNLKKLKDEFRKLKAQRESLHLLVEADQRNGYEILPIVLKWLKDFDEIKRAVDEEESQTRTDCSWRACPNPWSRYQLSKKAEKILTPEVIKLKGEGNFNTISRPKPPVAKWRGSSSTSFSKGNEAFNSRISAMNMIMDALADPTINKIGLCGLGGVGKTTLAHDVASRAEGEKFTVVMVEVTPNPDYKKIQNEIGDMVGVQFHEESELIRAGRLCERLKQEKNLFVILDNLWKRLDLDKIGIPSTAEQEKGNKVIQSTDDRKGCKLLLISRDEEVLSNQMNCKKVITLGLLSENEASELFNEMAEIQLDSDPDLLSIATDVARVCAGLPVAIVTVARALRKKSLSEWRNALRQLQNPALRDVTGLRKEVYAPIKLSYDNLETDVLKSIFLLSSMLYNNLFTSDLLKYCIGLDVFKGTLEDARDDLHTLINKLKASRLFLDSFSGDCFAMHDIVRDVALSVLSDENRALSVRYNKLDEWPKKKQLENYEWMCLFQSDIGKLPEKLSCPTLQFFLLADNDIDRDMIIPDSFFKELHGLKVMDLTGVNLPSLPNSIIHLTDLRTLCLDHCVLGDISLIGELKILRVLSLIGSTIQQLPHELGELTQLQLMDLSRCSKLKVIPPNVISKLEKLEEMYLGSSFNQWQHEESNDESSANASLSELMNLPNLSNLHIHIPHASMLGKNMFSDRLNKYKILVGDVWEWSGMSQTSRTLKLKFNASIHSEMFGVRNLMDRVEDLFLDEVNGIKSVLYELNRAGFPQLKRLQIQNNSQIEYIIDLRQFHVLASFPKLETLVLKNMIGLKKLCDRQLSVNSFCKLTSIKVRNCDKLNNLFHVSMLRSLPKLVEIEVSECKLMQEIVDLSSEQEIEDEGILEFYQLRTLTMSSLPALVGFCSYYGRYLAMAPGIEKQNEIASSSDVIKKEDKANPSQHLFSNKVAFPSLETLKLSALNFQNIWHDSTSASSWANLTDLSVEGCQSLRHIMPSAVARGFVKLKHLNICRCDMVEMIIFPNATHTSFTDEIIWHNQFGPNSYGEIKKVKISYCQKLIAFRSVEKIELVEYSEMIDIWEGKLSNWSFNNLKSVIVDNCDFLFCVIPSYLLNLLNNLEELQVSNCNSVEAVFDLQDMKEPHALPQLQLKSITLQRLPKLKSVWNKDPHQINFCQYLQKVTAFECESLSSIFPASIAKYLSKFEELRVTCCLRVEVIVEKDEVAGVAPCFEFPQLHTLELRKLPNLKNFYPEKHTSEWPQLRCLKVYMCPNVEVFGSEIRSTIETYEKNKLEARHPLFFVEKVVPNLEELVLNQKAITMIRNNQFEVDLFHKVKLLYLESFTHEPVTFPCSFLGRFPNLNELRVSCSSFVEIFPSQGATGSNLGKYAPIKILGLAHLEQLKIIWHNDSQVELLLQNLESLIVECCSSLINLAPSSASFVSLRELDVSGSHQLIYLVTSSTAKSLVHLKALRVNDCKMIEEIIVDEGEIEEKEIPLKELHYLALTDLPSLKSFCSLDYKFKFSSLHKVVVRGCPDMKKFCSGVLATPLLEGVSVEGNKKHWEGDLNNTIEQLFLKKDGQNSSEG